MGQIWGAANRAEGYRIGAKDGVFVLILDVVIWTCHGVWRFFSGRPLLGDAHRKTHATWGEGSRQPLRRTQRPPTWWSCLAEKHRAAIRVGLLILAFDMLWGSWSGPFGSFFHGLFTIAGIVIAWTFLYLMTKGLTGKFTDRRWTRVFVEPLKSGIGPIIGVASRDVKVRIHKRRTLGG